MSQPMHMLVVRVRSMTVNVSVNGVPVLVNREPTAVVTTRELSAVCNSGENTVSAEFGGGPGRFSISVFRRTTDATITAVCSATGAAPAQETLGFTGQSTGLEGSGDQPIAELDAASRDEIAGRVAVLRARLANGDAMSVLQLLDEKINRRAAEIGVSPAVATDTQRRTIDAIIEHQRTIEPIPNDLEFHVVRDGREVLVCRPDGRGPIVASTPSLEISLRPSFARTAAGWAIVR